MARWLTATDNTALGDLLGITEAALDTADPVSLARSYVGAMRRAASRPWRTVPRGRQATAPVSASPARTS